MKYDDTTYRFLKGIEFSNGASFKICDKSNENVFYSDEYLVELSRNKKILHIGCVDHLALIDDKIKSGRWLHKKLIDSADICFGIDINKEGITYLQDKYNINNLYALDIISGEVPEKILKFKFDYIFLPDVIEHIGNPVNFLKNIRKKFKHNAEKIILTTPNGFGWDNFINTFKNKEIINTDHRFWFTPYTLSKVVVDAGFNINKLDYVEHGKLSRKKPIKKMIVSYFRPFRDTLIMEASF